MEEEIRFCSQQLPQVFDFRSTCESWHYQESKPDQQLSLESAFVLTNY